MDDGPVGVVVQVSVSDGTVSATATRSIQVRNVRPTVDAGGDRTGYWGVPFPLVATATDPSSADLAAGLHYAWDLGDGAAAETASTTHTHVAPGRYELAVTATDKDRGIGRDTVTVQVDARPTSLSYTGDTTAAFGLVTLSARLADEVDPATSDLAGREVMFTVAGAQYRTAVDASGAAVITEPVLVLPGTHEVEVRFAGDTHYLPSAAAGHLLVGSTAGKVTGGGIVTADSANAGFVVQSDGSSVSGQLEFTSRVDRISLHLHDFLALGISDDGTSAWFAGTELSGALVMVHVEDLGEPGLADDFRLWLDGARLGGDAAPLRGNIEIHAGTAPTAP